MIVKFCKLAVLWWAYVSIDRQISALRFCLLALILLLAEACGIRWWSPRRVIWWCGNLSLVVIVTPTYWMTREQARCRDGKPFGLVIRRCVSPHWASLTLFMGRPMMGILQTGPFREMVMYNTWYFRRVKMAYCTPFYSTTIMRWRSNLLPLGWKVMSITC